MFFPGQKKPEKVTVALSGPADWEPEAALKVLLGSKPRGVTPGTQLADKISKQLGSSYGAYFVVKLKVPGKHRTLWTSPKHASMVVNSIVHTAGQGIQNSIMPSYPVSIKILVNDRPLPKLKGHPDYSQPIEYG